MDFEKLNGSISWLSLFPTESNELDNTLLFVLPIPLHQFLESSPMLDILLISIKILSKKDLQIPFGNQEKSDLKSYEIAVLLLHIRHNFLLSR